MSIGSDLTMPDDQSLEGGGEDLVETSSECVYVPDHETEQACHGHLALGPCHGQDHSSAGGQLFHARKLNTRSATMRLPLTQADGGMETRLRIQAAPLVPVQVVEDGWRN